MCSKAHFTSLTTPVFCIWKGINKGTQTRKVGTRKVILKEQFAECEMLGTYFTKPLILCVIKNWITGPNPEI